ncbi:transglycosylase SLT domain-containing protein [Kitasatospora sp. NPDC002040]|uniref:transglycosylase SLT domain-containing protein n=1 Tax=Kitasatospora sp. NPDC002040 TaxID=3154661 RepID=UPI003329D18B
MRAFNQVVNRVGKPRIRYDRLPNQVLGLGVAGAIALTAVLPFSQAMASQPADAAQPVAAAAPAAEPAAAPAEAPAPAAEAPAPAAAAEPAAPAAPTYADNLDGWIHQAQDVLRAAGKPVPSYKAMYATAMAESTGNPKAVNGWDSNASAGTPSIGLTQMIQPTFKAYALPGHTDIRNPVDNLVASSRYTDAVYGGMDKMAAARGYGSHWKGY